MNHFFVDVETTDIESTTIVLAAAIVYFDLDKEFTFEELKERTLFVKFDVREQKSKGRTLSKDTIDWWMSQPQEVRSLSFTPKADDLTVVEGLDKIREYIKQHDPEGKAFFWQRGVLDSTSLESLCRSFQVPQLCHYNAWMDIRTGVRILKETADKYGYCKIENFDRNQVAKHNPIDDVCYDTMMLKYGV